MNSSFITSLRKPPIYTKSMVEFWNDEYISEQMLKAHLNPEFDGASRKLDFIEKSVARLPIILCFLISGAVQEYMLKCLPKRGIKLPEWIFQSVL